MPMPTEKPTPQPSDQSIVPESQPKPTTRPARKHRWKLIAVVLLLVAALLVGIPSILRALNTVSTDDAYVNGYVTFVAPRVSGQVARVLVDDNNRVKIGDVLVELDPEPYQVQVAIKQAAVDTAQANLVVAEATVRGLIGQARSQRFKLARAIEDVDKPELLPGSRARPLWCLPRRSLIVPSVCSRPKW